MWSSEMIVINLVFFSFYQDFGYSSNRSTISRKDEKEDEDRSGLEMAGDNLLNLQNLPEIDVGLLLKLQQKLKEVEKDRDRLLHRVESLEKEESPTEERQRTIDSIKVMQNFNFIYCKIYHRMITNFFFLHF